jgi:hypothetical protein
MTNLLEDDTSKELAPGERKRRSKKALPKPLIRLLVLLAAIVVIVVVVTLVVRSAINSRESAGYQKYMTEVSGILKNSDAVWAALTTLLTKPSGTTRKDLQTRLDTYTQKCSDLATQAEKMKVPSQLVKADVHQMFVTTMQLREKGLVNLKPSLMNALEVQDVVVSSEQVSRALKYLTLSDFLYDEVFVQRATDVLKQKNLTGVNVPTTQFLTDPDLDSSARVQAILTALKSTGNLQAVHGVGLIKVVVLPDEKTLTANDTFNLVASDQLTFQVTIENQGNMSEKDVPVKVTLYPTSAKTESKTVNVPEIKPQEQLTVTVKGLNPTPYGEKSPLKVEVGPVKDEKVKDNNTFEAFVIFTL